MNSTILVDHNSPFYLCHYWLSWILSWCNHLTCCSLWVYSKTWRNHLKELSCKKKLEKAFHQTATITLSMSWRTKNTWIWKSTLCMASARWKGEHCNYLLAWLVLSTKKCWLWSPSGMEYWWNEMQVGTPLKKVWFGEAQICHCIQICYTHDQLPP